MKIGILGGTFDPIHNGHLLVAEEARDYLNLAKIIFMPAGQPYLKETASISSSKHRLEMVRLAISGKAYFELSSLEIKHPGPSYTVDTLAELEALLKSSDELFFILGLGSLKELARWKEPGRLIELCQLVAVPRPGYEPPDLKALEAEIPGLRKRLILMDKPKIDISASDIRRRVAQGLAISHLVPEVVEKYIREHRLYLSGK